MVLVRGGSRKFLGPGKLGSRNSAVAFYGPDQGRTSDCRHDRHLAIKL